LEGEKDPERGFSFMGRFKVSFGGHLSTQSGLLMKGADMAKERKAELSLDTLLKLIERKMTVLQDHFYHPETKTCLSYNDEHKLLVEMRNLVEEVFSPSNEYDNEAKWATEWIVKEDIRDFNCGCNCGCEFHLFEATSLKMITYRRSGSSVYGCSILCPSCTENHTQY
jgi:hypothetical protein